MTVSNLSSQARKYEEFVRRAYGFCPQHHNFKEIDNSERALVPDELADINLFLNGHVDEVKKGTINSMMIFMNEIKNHSLIYSLLSESDRNIELKSFGRYTDIVSKTKSLVTIYEQIVDFTDNVQTKYFVEIDYKLEHKQS